MRRQWISAFWYKSTKYQQRDNHCRIPDGFQRQAEATGLVLPSAKIVVTRAPVHNHLCWKVSNQGKQSNCIKRRHVDTDTLYTNRLNSCIWIDCNIGRPWGGWMNQPWCARLCLATCGTEWYLLDKGKQLQWVYHVPDILIQVRKTRNRSLSKSTALNKSSLYASWRPNQRWFEVSNAYACYIGPKELALNHSLPGDRALIRHVCLTKKKQVQRSSTTSASFSTHIPCRW